MNNLLVLCKACHLIKLVMSMRVANTLKISESESSFNELVQDAFDSPLSQTYTFVEKVYFDELQ